MYILQNKLANLFQAYVLLGFVLLAGCISGDSASTHHLPADVIIETDLGEIGIALYPQTPIHRDNFLQLARTGYYDSLNFHRIILGFMIQSGDPSTRPSQRGGANGPGYTLEAEIIDTLVHTRGKLAAARLPDEQNPDRRSAGSQFYIVTGKIPLARTLDSMEVERSKVYRGDYYEQYAKLADSIRQGLSFDAYLEQSDFQPYRYSQAHREEYLTAGGSPHLDFTYTIFGEVVLGLDVVRKIEVQITDDYNRPQRPVRIRTMQIVADSTLSP